MVVTSVPKTKARSDRLLAQFGPVTVTRASLLPLQLLVGAAVLLNLLLVGLLIALWNRARRLELRLQSGDDSGERSALDET